MSEEFTPLSPFMQEFIWRGYFNQCTNLTALDAAMEKRSIMAYIGFDLTAQSLHIGSLIQIMICRLLQKHGHYPIILLGRGTSLIGDPSGKDIARTLLDKENIAKNKHSIQDIFIKIIGIHLKEQRPDNDYPIPLFVDNYDWLSEISCLTMMRDYGKYFSINQMLTADSVKSRLEREQHLSYLEFSYAVLQAYDFLYLHQRYDCELQIGGSDQWGNIVAGAELIRKYSAENSDEELCRKKLIAGLTSPLITRSDGKKMGKTEQGAIWLNERLTSPFDYYQYFRNIVDEDVVRFLKLFTDLSREEIDRLESCEDINKMKETLAFEATKICHGTDEAVKAMSAASGSLNHLPLIHVEHNFQNGPIGICKVLLATGWVLSNGEARRKLAEGAIKINGKKIDDQLIFEESSEFSISFGSKKHMRIKI